MRMIPIEGSSYIAEIGYDDATQKMRVKFKDGMLVESDGKPVSAGDFAAFLDSKSKGKYWHAHIKGSWGWLPVPKEESLA